MDEQISHLLGRFFLISDKKKREEYAQRLAEICAKAEVIREQELAIRIAAATGRVGYVIENT